MGLLSNYLEKRIDLAEFTAGTITGDIEGGLMFKALAVEIATSYLANVLSKCEIKTFEAGKEVKKEWYYRFNISPNTNENATFLKQKLIHNLIYDGHALMFTRNKQLYVADSFGIERNPFASDIYTNVSINNSSITGNIRAENAFYFKLNDTNITALINSMYNDYEKLIQTASEVYQEAGGQKYKLILEGVKAGDKTFNEEYENVIKKQLKEFINSRRAVYPQFKGYDLQEISKSDGKTDSSDILALRKDTFELVAEAFKMPVSMLYGNMNNVKDIINGWVTVSVDPLAKMINEELTRKTTDYQTFNNGNYVKLDTTAITHIDIFDIAENADKLISSGVYCIDDVLEKLGEARLNTEFTTTRWITKNYTKAEDALTAGGGVD